MPAPHAFYSKMLAERTASRNVFVLFYFIYLFKIVVGHRPPKAKQARSAPAGPANIETIL
jgi:hypothetical protein